MNNSYNRNKSNNYNKNRNERGGYRRYDYYDNNKNRNDINDGSGRNYNKRYDRSASNILCREPTAGKECKFNNCAFFHGINILGIVQGHESTVNDLVLWEKQSKLLTASSDSELKLWCCNGWTESMSIPVTLPILQQEPGASLNLSQPKKAKGINTIALADSWVFLGFTGASLFNKTIDVGYIRAWNLDAPQTPPYDFQVSPTTPYSHSLSVSSLSVATDANGIPTLFSGSSDGSIKYWQFVATMNQFKLIGMLEGHARKISRMKTSTVNGKPILVSCSWDGTIKIWDLTTFSCIKILTEAEGGHCGAINDMIIWEYLNEPYLITAGLDKNIIIWSMKEPFSQVFKELQADDVTALCCMEDISKNPIILIGLSTGKIQIKSLPSFEFKLTINAYKGMITRIESGPLNTFFTTGADKETIAWQVIADISALPTVKKK